MTKANEIIRNAIASEAETLNYGETITIECFNCGGGSTKAATLSITKKESGQIGFICFRDSCQIKGYIRASGYTLPVKKETKEKKPKEIKVEKLLVAQHEDIPSPIELQVQEKYQVSLKKHCCRWEPSTNRVLFPIFDHYIELQGYVARSYSGAEPKALTYKKENYAGAGWFQTGFIPTKTLVVVEDPTSACAVVDNGIDSVALLGTNLSEEVIAQIRDCNYEKVYVALDYDALTKCITNARQLINGIVLPLEKDIKDMTLQEREDLLSCLR